MRKGRVLKSKLSDCCNLLSVLDTALEAKVLANKDESKCFKPLIAVIRPVRDRYHISMQDDILAVQKTASSV